MTSTDGEISFQDFPTWIKVIIVYGALSLVWNIVVLVAAIILFAAGGA